MYPPPLACPCTILPTYGPALAAAATAAVAAAVAAAAAAATAAAAAPNPDPGAVKHRPNLLLLVTAWK